jgi:hypothetical protein
MPKGPQGQKRPADVIGAAVLVGRIAVEHRRSGRFHGRAGRRTQEARAV